jgi:hypothetical protein
LANKKIYLRRIAAFFFLSLLIYVGIKIAKGFDELDRSIAQDLPPSYTLSSEDSTLINKKYINGLRVDEIFRRKGREPVSLIHFENDYHLIINKIHLSKDMPLKNLIHIKNENVDRSSLETYSVIYFNDFYKFQYHATASKPASEIYLTLAGDSLKTIAENDSIISYHLRCENFSIRYSAKEPIDIFVVGRDRPLGGTLLIPMDLLFLKRRYALYLLILTPNNSMSKIEGNLLYNIVLGL